MYTETISGGSLVVPVGLQNIVIVADKDHTASSPFVSLFGYRNEMKHWFLLTREWVGYTTNDTLSMTAVVQWNPSVFFILKDTPEIRTPLY